MIRDNKVQLMSPAMELIWMAAGLLAVIVGLMFAPYVVRGLVTGEGPADAAIKRHVEEHH